MASVVEFVALGPGGAHLVTARALAALHPCSTCITLKWEAKVKPESY